MPAQDDIDRKIRELEESNRILQIENDQLAERAEDTLLLGLIAEQFGTAEEIEPVLERGLERISVLKDIPFCACCSLTGNEAVVIKSYLSFGDEDLVNRTIVLPDALLQDIADGGLLPDSGVREYTGLSVKLASGVFKPVAVCCIPFVSRYAAANLFMFADDRPENRFPRLLDMLHRVVEMMASRIDNIVLLQELRSLNRALDNTVEERTRELREREHEYRTLAENLPDNIIRYDLEGRVVYVNPVIEKTLRADAARMLGKRVREFYPDGSYEAYAQALDAALASGENGEIELTLPFQSKEAIVHQIRFIVERDEHGEVTGVLAIGRDITGRKRAEEEIRKLNQELEQRVANRTAQLEFANKELEAFSYSVSHDLRAPLRAVDGFSKILLDDYAGKLDEEGKRLLNVVRDNTRRMEQLIEDILKFSRTGRSEMALSEIDMEKMVREVADELEPDVAGSKLQVQVEHLPPARGDSAMVRQVFVNLLANAIKFSRTREVPRIEVGGYREGDEAVYFVKDNGVGFDMQHADKLFGVFKRLHSVEEFEGTGIGLAIVKRIVTRHGGRVWAESKINEGATIYFSLPRSTPETVAYEIPISQ